MPSGPSYGVLYAEHLALGATFGDEHKVQRYGSEPNPDAVRAHLKQGALLCDISSMQRLFFAGDCAPTFAHAAFAGRELPIGQCDFEAALTGDGSIASIPLLVRTGTTEYLACDFSSRAEVLSGWLSFLSAIEQNGVAPFAGMETQDVTQTHVALLLMGKEATNVLGDYVSKRGDLPAVGETTSCNLDSFPCIVVRPAVPKTAIYVVLVPPVHAVALWRSLLSFTQVEPIAEPALQSVLASAMPWYAELGTSSQLHMGIDELRRAGLIRSDDTSYVGYRGLVGSQKTDGGAKQ